MKTYDCLVVLGHGFVKDWEIPNHVHDRLRRVAKMYREGFAPKIILCGKWSINWDHENVSPPSTEAEVMRKVLVRFGVPNEAIIKEEQSQDTIGNIYFLKKNILEPNNFHNILFVTADFHVKRVKALVDKILGSGFYREYITTPTDDGQSKEFMQMQEEVMERQNNFLKDMQEADDVFLAQRLYADPYYLQKRPEKIAKSAMGR